MKKEVPEPIKELTPPPAPVPTPAPISEDLNVEQMEQLKAQIEKMEQKQEVPQEMEGSEPDDEEVQKIQQFQAEVERLQNNGIYRAEMLYQYVGLNSNLNRIATALEKLEGADAKE